MNTIDAIKKRYSCRAFLDKPVSKKILTDILETARWSPSGANSQSWEVAVVTGKTRKRLADNLVKASEEGKPAKQEFPYYPKKWTEPFKTRRFQCGIALYNAINIKREDNERRKEQWKDNYKFFNAPAALFFFIEKNFSHGGYINIGTFIQSIMLTAFAHNLGTCAQAALGDYPDIVKSELKISNTKILICGMSIGYPDIHNKVNKFRTEREPVSSFTTWFD